MSPQIPSHTIISRAVRWSRGAVLFSSPLQNFRKQMELGVAAVAMLSLAFYSREAGANVDESLAIGQNCAAVRPLGNAEYTTFESGAGVGYATIGIHGFGSVDGCGNKWQDDTHFTMNGTEGLAGCFFALGGGGVNVYSNPFGASVSGLGGADISITIPLNFLNGPNLLTSWWVQREKKDWSIGNEGWCISSLVINHPPKITPPPPLLTAAPTPGAPSGPGSTVPPEPAGTPPPMPLVCGEVGGNSPMPVCVEGNCSAPTGFRYKCSTTYDVLTFTWDASAGAKGYNLRLNFKGNDSPTCKDGWYCPGSADENIIGTANTSYSFDVIPGAEYKAWIQYVGSDGKESGMQIFDPIVCKAP